MEGDRLLGISRYYEGDEEVALVFASSPTELDDLTLTQLKTLLEQGDLVKDTDSQLHIVVPQKQRLIIELSHEKTNTLKVR